jgi:hypothetical protein
LIRHLDRSARTALKDIRGRNTERATVAENSQRSHSCVDQAVTSSPYHKLADVLRELHQLSTKARRENTSYFGKIKQFTRDWDAADALARNTSASRGIPCAAFNQAINEAKTLVIELAQVAAGDVTVPFDPHDTKYAKAERRLEELGETYAGASGRLPPEPEVSAVSETPRAIGPHDTINALFTESAAQQRLRDEAKRAKQERDRRLQEHMTLREKLAGALDRASQFPNEENEQRRKPCPEGFRLWAERFIEVGDLIRECDEAIELLRLSKRLQGIAATTAPLPMKFACALLVQASGGNTEEIADVLERSNGDPDLRRFVRWLPFVLDNLWRPYHQGSVPVWVALPPPDATSEEYRQAGAAFGWRDISIIDEPPGARTPPTDGGPAADTASRVEPSASADATPRNEDGGDGGERAVEEPRQERPVTEPRQVNWKAFAIGKDARGAWQHFRFQRGQWRHYGKLKVRRQGTKQDGLLNLLLKGAGRLTEDDAVKLWHDPASMKQATLGKLEPELTNLRNAIRKARDVGKDTSDPLPPETVDGTRCWIAQIQFGHAGQVDGRRGDHLDTSLHFYLVQGNTAGDDSNA